MLFYFNLMNAPFNYYEQIVTFYKGKIILGDPGADSGGEGKSKRVGKNGEKKSKEQGGEREGTIFYQTSSKRWRPFWLLIGARNFCVFLPNQCSRPWNPFCVFLYAKYMKESAVRHVYLGCSRRLYTRRWKDLMSEQNPRENVRNIYDYLTG